MSYKIGDKVKLPRLAFDWMESIKSRFEEKNEFEYEIWCLMREDFKKVALTKMINCYKLGVIDLVNAYQFGYELEETEEEKEFKKVRKHLFDMGIQLPNEEIEILIKIVKGDNNV